jgi:3-oxoacyl-[acyl-carrier protein] reductase
MSGRAILITGGSRGIGRAVARRFAEAGDRVAVHHRDSAALAAGLLTELPGTGHAVVQADLADPAAVRTMVDEAAGLLGGLDVLVNNAGVFTPHPITDVSYEQWQAQWQVTLGVNLIGAANVTWCAVQHMTGRGAQGRGANSGRGAQGGRIINVSSRGAFRGEPQSPAYGASKAGLNAFGQSLAIALAPHGIAVCTVAPGFVATDMTNEHLRPPRGDEIRAQSPFGRVADPDEIAAGIFYLAAAEAQWASGAILDLNGASYLRT